MKVNINAPISVFSYNTQTVLLGSSDVSATMLALIGVILVSIIFAFASPRRKQTRVHQLVLCDYSSHSAEIETKIAEAQAQMYEGVAAASHSTSPVSG